MLNDVVGLGIYFIVTPIIFASNLLPITPGGLGVGESVSSFLLDASGSAIGASIMLVFRVVIVLLAIVMGLPAFFINREMTIQYSGRFSRAWRRGLRFSDISAQCASGADSSPPRDAGRAKEGSA